MKAATTKRYYLTSAEIEEALELEGKIETVHQVTPYEQDQDVNLKGVEFIITTVIDIEEQEEVIDKGGPDYLNRHLIK